MKGFARKLNQTNEMLNSYDLNTRQKYAWCSLPIKILFLQEAQTIPFDLIILIISYQYNLTSKDIVDLFGKLTLHFYREFLFDEINNKYFTLISFTKTHMEQARELISKVENAGSSQEITLILEKEKTSLQTEFKETRELSENTKKGFVEGLFSFFKPSNTNQEETSQYYGIIERHHGRLNNS